MLPKRYKLPVQYFSSLRGKKYSSSHFILVIFPSEYTYPRFGVVTQRKYITTAVSRNVFKRIFFDFAQNELKMIPSGDYLIRVKASFDVKYTEMVRSELNNLFSYIKK